MKASNHEGCVRSGRTMCQYAAFEQTQAALGGRVNETAEGVAALEKVKMYFSNLCMHNPGENDRRFRLMAITV